MEWIIVIPKNRSLAGCRKIAEKLIHDEGIKDYRVLEARGEDVAFFVNELLKENKKVLGVTGEDLFREWQLENSSEKLDIIRRYEWKDKKALFGKPILCLLGPKDKQLNELPKKMKIAISNKYKKISDRYLSILENKGYSFEKIYLSGSVEDAFYYGIADMVIDIIYTGKSAKEKRLKCYDKIYESDIVAIGKRGLHLSIPKIAIKK